MPTKHWLAGFLSLFLTLALLGCQPQALPAALPGRSSSSVAATPAPAATAAPLPTYAPSGAVVGEVGYLQPAAPMVIKDASFELAVDDVGRAVALVTQLAADHGGYILSSQTWFDGDDQYATLRLAVPAAEFESVLNELRRLGIKVLHENTSGQDVSAEYTDLQSQLVNLEATAARVRTFLDAADTVEESLAISAELSRLEGQIEQAKGQMRYYAGRSAFSTVSVALSPELAPETPTPEPAWSPQRTFAKATSAAGHLGQAALDLLIWLAVLGLPIILVLAAGIGLVRLALRRGPPARP